VPRTTDKLLTAHLALSLFCPLAPSTVDAQETRTIWVAHRRVDCIGVARQKCYLIKDSQYEDWKFWYGEIAGLDFEPGYAYEILVAEEKIEDPPADAPSVRLRLVEVVLKVETFERPDPEPSPPPLPATVTPEKTVPAPEPTPAPAPAFEPAPPVTPTIDGAVLRGHLSIGTGIETRSFKLCGAEQSLWVEDRTDGDLWDLYRQLSGYPNRPLYMAVRGEVTDSPPGGFGANYEQQILIREVRNTATESAGCFEDLTRFAFRALGNEPFWQVEISKRGFAFSEMSREGRVLFPYAPPSFADNQIIYRSQTGGIGGTALLVKLRDRPCVDTMADARFSYQAEVEIEGKTLQGCALEGEAEP